ncbi:hypothetical protein M407DRAFT_18114, partial [Tulasnella calospora MUT 4182]
MLKVALGGLYIRQAAPAVRRPLARRDDGDLNAVLDIGCGSGCWVIDMAKQYPHTELTGMDLTPPDLGSPIPENIRFECDDANYGLSQYFPESQDVVHIRCVSIGIKDYRSLLGQVYNVLRPGGVLLTVDCDMLAYGENQEPITAMSEGESGFSWMNLLLATAFQGIISHSPNAEAYIHTYRWIREMGDNGSPWEEYGERAVWIPLGPWTKELGNVVTATVQGNGASRREFMAAKLMQRTFQHIGATLRPVLLASGNSDETVDRWIREQEAELSYSSSISALPPTLLPSAVMDEETASQSSGIASRSESPYGATEGSVIVASSSPRTSVYSYTSSVEKHLILKELHGRIVNNTNDQYMLPADGEEHGRLDVQHEMLKAALGGLYVRQAAPAVCRALAVRKDGDPNAILDIGTGSGCWVIDMAKRYPQAEAVGMDLAPPNFASPPPANARFECDDANHGFSQYFPESFDIVHARCITIGITDYRSLLGRAYNVLRPGGVLLTVDCDMIVYNENQEPFPSAGEGEPGFSWLNLVINTSLQAILNRNPGARAYFNTSRWIKDMGEKGCPWDESGERVVWVPLGPWTKELQGDRVNRREFIAAQLMQEDCTGIGGTLRPILVASGNPEENVDR